MSSAASPTEGEYRHRDYTADTLSIEQETITVYRCPLERCDADPSETKVGFRFHLIRSHNRHLARATMECQACSDEFDVAPSEMHKSYCSPDCSYEDGHNDAADPVVLDAPLEPIEETATRYPCPVDDCDSVCTSERGLRKHATESHNGLGRPSFDCEECGSTFHVKPSEAEAARFCSYECLYESRRERIERECDYCEEPYETIPSRSEISRFCSIGCVALGTNHPTPNIAGCDPEDLGLSPFGENPPVGSVPYGVDSPVLVEAASSLARLAKQEGERPDSDEDPSYGTVVCAEHGVQYPAAWHGCPECSVSNKSRGAIGHETHSVRLAQITGANVSLGDFRDPHDDPQSPTVHRGQCNEWREALLDTQDLDAVAGSSEFSAATIEMHAIGACEHGFESSVMPVRNNGAEWTSTGIDTAERSIVRPSRRGATFDG